MDDRIIAVTGATGQQGGAVALKLLADGWKVRALTRDPNKPAAQELASRGVTTATFDFPYITARRKAPDRAPVLEDAWREAIDAARAQFADLPLFIGGKSMGGRMTSRAAA